MLLIPKRQGINNIVVEIRICTRWRPRCGCEVDGAKAFRFYAVKTVALRTDEKITGIPFLHYIHNTVTRQVLKNGSSYQCVIPYCVLVKVTGSVEKSTGPTGKQNRAFFLESVG